MTTGGVESSSGPTGPVVVPGGTGGFVQEPMREEIGAGVFGADPNRDHR